MTWEKAVPWWVAGLLANIAICGVEYFNRTRGAGGGGWLTVLPFTFPFIVLGQWALYRSWNGAPTMMVAWMYFTLGNNVIRLASSYWLVGERFGWQVPVGCAVMFAGSWLVKAGMK
jgi:hypothetical protein